MRLRLLLSLFVLALSGPLRAGGSDGWTAAWASAQMIPVNDQVVPHEWLEDATVRQVVRVGLSGPRLRLRLSNAHGAAPLAIPPRLGNCTRDSRVREVRRGEHLACSRACIGRLPGRPRNSTIQDVGETAAQPCLTGDVVVAAVDVLVEHVCVATAQAPDFLLEPLVAVLAQVAVTAIP